MLKVSGGGGYLLMIVGDKGYEELTWVSSGCSWSSGLCHLRGFGVALTEIQCWDLFVDSTSRCGHD